MSRCKLCFPVTGHEADYALTFGKDERSLKVCRYCHEDLTLLGFNANQTVRLAISLKRRVARFWFLGCTKLDGGFNMSDFLFSVPSGEAVALESFHYAIIGQTRFSGKTTLIKRLAD